MQLKILKDYTDLSLHAATMIINQIKKKKNSVLCFASGDTPRLTLQKMVEMAQADHIDCSSIQFVGLDEWVGISPDVPGSCSSFFHETFLSPLQIPNDNIHLFDAMASDLQVECAKMDELISALGGIDIMVVGIGVNGHIGFNEPHTPWNLKAHVAELHESTRTVGQKYFDTSMSLTEGITLGFQYLLDASQVILMASGLAKSDTIRTALTESPSEKIPASVITVHAGGWVLLDEAAASAFSPAERKAVCKVRR